MNVASIDRRRRGRCFCLPPARLEPAARRRRRRSAPIAPILDRPDAVDIHSYAKPLEARVTHVALDLDVDFDAKRVGGTATLDIEAKPGAKEIILDDKGLEIDVDHRPPTASRCPTRSARSTRSSARRSTIADGRRAARSSSRYKSAPDAGALQWLTPEQTAGKKHPYLLSQGQAIENRSWIPTQDSPGIRQTWEAHDHASRSR